MSKLYPSLINKIERVLETRDSVRTWATFDEIKRRFTRSQALSISAENIAAVDARLTARRKDQWTSRF
jgi:hypothetical protein